jgi:hypothetical protein
MVYCLLFVLMQFPVSDGYIPREIGIKYQMSPDHAATIESVFSSGRKWKDDIGPIKAGTIQVPHNKVRPVYHVIYTTTAFNYRI